MFELILAALNWQGVHEHSRLEDELPRDRRQSSISSWESKLVQSDDPRWIRAEQEVSRTSDAEMDAAVQLVNIIPTTKAGLCALLKHAVDYDTDGEGWPRGLESDDGKRVRDWEVFLIENLAKALPDILDVV